MLGLQKSNVHRTLATLIEAGFVRPGASRGSHAISRGELVQEIGGIAAPVFGRDGVVCAALSISSPLTRQAAKEKQYVALAVEAARKITQSLAAA